MPSLCLAVRPARALMKVTQVRWGGAVALVFTARIHKGHAVIYEAILERLRARGMPFTIHEHDELAGIAAAQHLDLPTEHLLRTRAYRTREDDLLLVVTRWEDALDPDELADQLDLRRSHLTLLTDAEVRDLFGVEPDSLSPIALSDDVSVLIDEAVMDLDVVYCGVGRVDRTLELRVVDLIYLTEAQVGPIIVEPDDEE